MAYTRNAKNPTKKLLEKIKISVKWQDTKSAYKTQ